MNEKLKRLTLSGQIIKNDWANRAKLVCARCVYAQDGADCIQTEPFTIRRCGMFVMHVQCSEMDIWPVL